MRLFVRVLVDELGNNVHSREQRERKVVGDEDIDGPISLEENRPST